MYIEQPENVTIRFTEPKPIHEHVRDTIFSVKIDSQESSGRVDDVTADIEKSADSMKFEDS